MTLAMMTILAVPFLHPWLAAAGAGLAAVPILIHLLNRRRFRRVVWAAMEWLLAAQRKNARRIRIEQLLLLAVRCLIMLLIAMAIARPFLGRLGLASLFGQDRTVRVYVIDDSYSMTHGAGGTTTPLTRAKESAGQLLDMLDGDDAVAVVLAGRPARVLIEQPSYDRKAVREAIEAIEPTSRGTDLDGALKIAQAILSGDEQPIGRQVVIFSERGRSTWLAPGPAGDLVQPAPDDAPEPAIALEERLAAVAELAEITFVDLTPPEPGNVALTDLAARYEVLGDRSEVRMLAEVSNFTDKSIMARDLLVRLTVDSERGSSEMVQQLVTVDREIAPGKSVTVEKLISFPKGISHTVHAHLLMSDETPDIPGDHVAADNERHFTMRVQPHVRVLLLDGEPGRRLSDNETFYLNQALSPITATGRDALAEMTGYKIRTEVETLPQVAPGWLADWDLVVLANVDLLAMPASEKLARDLTDFVRRGGGLILFPGSQTDTALAFAEYNRLLFNEGNGVMPAKLVSAVGDSARRGEGLHFEVEATAFDHPILTEFDSSGGRELLNSPRAYRHMKMELPSDSSAKVLLRYTDGDPALVVGRVGEGYVAQFATSAGTDWNNYFNRPGLMVPLINKLAFQLSPVSDQSRNLAVGGALVEPLTAAGGVNPVELTLLRPGAGSAGGAVEQIVPTPIEGAPTDAKRRFMATSSPLAAPGIYRIDSGDEAFLYAVNPPARTEADVRSVRTQQLEATFAERVVAVVPSELSETRQELAGGREISKFLLFAVLALCLTETFLAQRFGHFDKN